MTKRDQWQHVRLPHTPPVAGNVGEEIACLGTSAVGDQFYADGVQLEQKVLVTPYVETNGATATRSAAQVRPPASLLQPQQGWVSMRFVPGWANNSWINNALTHIFGWMDAAGQNGFRLLWRGASQDWRMRLYSGGTSIGDANTAPQVFTFHTSATLTAYWKPGEWGVSINGAPFIRHTGVVPIFSLQTFFEIGSDGSGGEFADGRFKWFICGQGVLTDADAATLNSYGDAGPSGDPTLIPGKPSALWQANDMNASQPTYATATQTPGYAALLAQKPAGIVLRYVIAQGQDYQSLYLNNASYQVVFTNYATYQGVVQSAPGT
jgi:hypothetical protein